MTGCRSSCICVTESDFAFSISVEDATVDLGENFAVEITLRNFSGRSLRLAYSTNFLLTLIDGSPIYKFNVYHRPSFKSLERDGVMRWTRVRGFFDETGTFDLSFALGFTLNHNRRSEHHIGLVSNVIAMTVV